MNHCTSLNYKVPLFYILLTILIFSSTNAYTQFDDGNTYYTKGFSLKSSGVEYSNISELKFLSDSLIRIKSKLDGTSEKIIINSINSMSFRTGSYGWLGLAVGAAVGTSIGIIWANSKNDLGEGHPAGSAAYGILLGSSLIGTMIGGVIGVNIGKYDNYYFDKFQKDKAVKMKRILKTKR